jgi:hypothetical protein
MEDKGYFFCLYQMEWCFGVDDCGSKASNRVASYLPSLPFVIIASIFVFLLSHFPRQHTSIFFFGDIAGWIG